MTPPRLFSFGGGVQSVACLVLAAQGKIDFKTFVFANVGDNSENPETIQYLNEVVLPYAEKHGIEVIEVQRVSRDGRKMDIYDRLLETKRSIDIPVRMSNGAPGRRSCTIEFKIKPVAKYHKKLGATKDNPGVLGIGISMDEFQRMRSKSSVEWQVLEYPLIDLKLDRSACKQLIADAGLPVPPKSSCWFCPYHTLGSWRQLQANNPALYNKAVELEELINKRRESLGKDPVWFSSRAVPLPMAVGDGTFKQEGLFEERHSCGPYVCSQDDGQQ